MITFIVEGSRIAVENFYVGKIYTINFTDNTTVVSACIGKGVGNVVFQREFPDLIFNLDMSTASRVRSIDEFGEDYNELMNKPQINGITLSGNKTSSDLGLQGVIDSSHKLDADLVDDSTSTNKFVSAAQISAWTAKQDAIDSTHKLDADLVDDSTSTQKFATASQLLQIASNAAAIDGQQETTASGGNGYALINGIRLYVSSTAPTGTIPDGSIGVGW